MNSEVVYSTEKTMYRQYEEESKDPYNLTCIDGKKVGRKKCVGYCRSSSHPGFLQKKHILEHNCLGKECALFVEKTEFEKTKEKFALQKINHKKKEDSILNIANEQIKDCEGMKFIKAHHIEKNSYTLTFVAISNYDLQKISDKISQATEVIIKLKEVVCDWTEKEELILAK